MKCLRFRVASLLKGSVVFLFRRSVFVALSAIFLSTTPLLTPTAFATNCSSITGGSISDTGDGNWRLQWDALPDTTNIDYLLIFATSGVGVKSWYNNASGYQWSGLFDLAPTATSYTFSKSRLISFADTNGVQSMTFKVRKDNGRAGCYPLTLLGQIDLAAAPAAPTLNSVTAGDRRVTVAFTAGANNGAAITDYEYSLNGGSYVSAGTTSSPFTITGLSGRATYSVTLKARNSAGLSIASSSLSATTTDSSLDASEAVAAEAARLAAAAAEAARLAAAAAEAARLAAEAEAARRANEQRQMGDLSSVLPLINELIKEIEEGMSNTSTPKKKSSTIKAKQNTSEIKKSEQKYLKLKNQAKAKQNKKK